MERERFAINYLTQNSYSKYNTSDVLLRVRSVNRDINNKKCEYERLVSLIFVDCDPSLNATKYYMYRRSPTYEHSIFERLEIRTGLSIGRKCLRKSILS